MATTDPGLVEVKALNDATWPLFEALVERHDGIFGGAGASGSTPAVSSAGRATRAIAC
ncbi:hypothetical protein [Mobilicoccus caccae]|uniref:hypothetical protein n=1 Tax=Mobilicoccus caccae TaxID=1859295 RepID=UPI0032AFC6C7